MNTANPLIKPGFASDTTRSAKNLAQAAVKRMAQEPWEILRQAGRQATGTEEIQRPGENQENYQTDNSFEENKKLVEDRDRIRSQRLMQALQSELDEIKKKKEQEKLVKQQQEQMAKEEQQKVEQPLIEPSSRKGRRLFNFGKKTQMQRQQRQTENPIPPSG